MQDDKCIVLLLRGCNAHHNKNMGDLKAFSYSEVASASAANFEIAIREYDDFPNIYRLCFISRLIKEPPISIEFTLLNFEVLRQALSVLQKGCVGNACEEVVLLGQCFGRDVMLTQDDDWLKRFFILIGDEEFPLGDRLIFTIAGDDVEHFVIALKTIACELEA